jgi:hypothetical protein
LRKTKKIATGLRNYILLYFYFCDNWIFQINPARMIFLGEKNEKNWSARQWLITFLFILAVLGVKHCCFHPWTTFHLFLAQSSRIANEGHRWESNINVWFPFLYSQKWNCYFQNRIKMFCLPVPTLIYLWEIYIFLGSGRLFCCSKYVDQYWEYLNCSQTHECGNWDWGRAIPRTGVQYINGIFVAVRKMRASHRQHVKIKYRKNMCKGNPGPIPPSPSICKGNPGPLPLSPIRFPLTCWLHVHTLSSDHSGNVLVSDFSRIQAEL